MIDKYTPVTRERKASQPKTKASNPGTNTTINQNTLLPVYKLFSVINPIRDKGKPAAVFGSFGWSGEAVKLIEDHLKNLKLNVVCEGLTARFFPNSEESEKIVSLAQEFGQALQDRS